jgi:hypothetical protein
VDLEADRMVVSCVEDENDDGTFVDNELVARVVNGVDVNSMVD